MAQVYEAFEDYRPEVEGLLDAGDKAIRLDLYLDRSDALEAVGLRE